MILTDLILSYLCYSLYDLLGMEELLETIQRLKLRLSEGNLKTVIIPHISADGDAVGACSAFSSVLEQAGIENHILTCDFLPDYLKWLKNTEKAISYQDKAEKCKSLIAGADMIFMLDHNTIQREGDLEAVVKTFAGQKVIIDHHPDPDQVDFVISDTRVSSTCELLFMVIREIWGVEAITGEVANALYTGINTDTGGLNHNSSRPETYLVIARLLELGLNKAYVHENLYQHNRLSRLRLVGNSLLNKLTVHPVYPVALIPISKEELEKYDYKEGDLEGLVNIPLSVENVLVSIQITQRKERVKLSFRSKGDIPVNAWAKEHFNGGGHLNAAGGQSSMPIQQVVQKVRDTAAWFFDRYLPEHRPE